MNLTTHERPGVYSSYDASTLVRGSGGHKTVGLAAINSTASAGVPITVTSYEAAVAAFGRRASRTWLSSSALLCSTARPRW